MTSVRRNGNRSPSATPRAGGKAAGSVGFKKNHVPLRHPNADNRVAPPIPVSKSSWKFVDRAPEETEALLTCLLDMCRINGQPRIEALDKLIETMNETPPHGARAVVSFVHLKGLHAMVTVLGVSCPESRHRASKVLQEAIEYGHKDEVAKCKSWFFQVRANLEHDNIETKASGAALLRQMKPIPECAAAIPILLRSIRLESVLVREEAAGALLQLSGDKVCLEEMSQGTFIMDIVHHYSSNGSMDVREICSALLAVLARTSGKHRMKIVNNGGVREMLEGINPHFPDKMIDNVLQALQHLSVEERARKAYAEAQLADTLYDVVSGKGDFHSSARRRSFAMLETLNKTPEGVPREKFHGISSLTSDQDCEGLAQLFSLLPTAFICWQVRRVSRCWRKVTGMPETWQKVDFDRCTFMSAIKLRTFLEHAPLSMTKEASFFQCSKIESIGFSYLAKAMTGRSLQRVYPSPLCIACLVFHLQNIAFGCGESVVMSLVQHARGVIQDTVFRHRTPATGMHMQHRLFYNPALHTPCFSHRLSVLDMSECTHLKDDELIRLMKTSEGCMGTLRLQGCGLLSNKSMYGIVAHLDTTLRVLVHLCVHESVHSCFPFFCFLPIFIAYMLYIYSCSLHMRCMLT